MCCTPMAFYSYSAGAWRLMGGGAGGNPPGSARTNSETPSVDARAPVYLIPVEALPATSRMEAKFPWFCMGRREPVPFFHKLLTQRSDELADFPMCPRTLLRWRGSGSGIARQIAHGPAHHVQPHLAEIGSALHGRVARATSATLAYGEVGADVNSAR